MNSRSRSIPKSLSKRPPSRSDIPNPRRLDPIPIPRLDDLGCFFRPICQKKTAARARTMRGPRIHMKSMGLERS